MRYYITSSGQHYFYNGIREQVGWITGSGLSLSNGANKDFNYSVYHYSTAEQSLLMMQGYVTSSTSSVHIGAGSTGSSNTQYYNAATSVVVNVAANNITLANDSSIKHFIFTPTSLSIPDGAELDLNSDDAIRGIRFLSSGTGINTSFAAYNNGEGEIKLYVKDNYVIFAHRNSNGDIVYLYHTMGNSGSWGTASNSHWLVSDTEPS